MFGFRRLFITYNTMLLYPRVTLIAANVITVLCITVVHKNT